MSLSSDGLSAACPAGATEEATTAKTTEVVHERGFPRPGPRFSKNQKTNPKRKPARSRKCEGADKEMGETTLVSGSSGESDGSGLSTVSLRSAASLASSLGKSRRGRPPSTGEYAGLAKAKSMLAEVEERELRLKQEKELMSLTSEDIFKSADLDVESAIDEIRLNPTADLTNRVRQLQKTVLRVSKTSKHLKGTYVKELKMAALYTTACVEVLRNRAEDDDNRKNDDGQVRDLRRRLAEAEKKTTELATIKEEMEEIKKQHTQAMGEIVRLKNELEGRSDNPPMRTRWQKRGRQVSDSESSSPERTAASKKKPRQKSKSASPREKKERGMILPREDGEYMETDAGPSEESAPVRESKKDCATEEVIPPVIRPPIKGVVKIIESREIRGTRVVIRERERSPKGTKPQTDTGSPAEILLRGMMPLLEDWLEKRMEGLLPSTKNKAGSKETRPKQPLEKVQNKREETKGKLPPSLPPRASRGDSDTDGTEWAKVVGRKAKRTERTMVLGEPAGRAPNIKKAAGAMGVTRTPKKVQRNEQRRGSVPPSVKRIRPPRTAAVTLTCPTGQYAEAMRVARGKINLEEIGVKALRAKRALTGALILEIPGPEGTEKAIALKGRLQEALKDMEGVRVARPVKMAEIRVKDIPETSTEEEVRLAICNTGECTEAEVRVGAFRRGLNGMSTVWVSCPVAAANKVASRSRIHVGWFEARTELLPARPLTCFRCLEQGHVQTNCRSTVDRRDRCYQCGQAGHIARECVSPPNCPLCKEAGRTASHRVGSAACGKPWEGPLKRKKEHHAVRGDPLPNNGIGGSTVPARPRGKNTRPAVRGDSPPTQVEGSPVPVRSDEGGKQMEEVRASMEIDEGHPEEEGDAGDTGKDVHADILTCDSGVNESRAMEINEAPKEQRKRRKAKGAEEPGREQPRSGDDERTQG